MNKILIPQKFVKIIHKQVQLLIENFSNKKSPFSKLLGHYVLDLTNTDKVYHDFQANFFNNFGVLGTFEVKSNQDINLMIIQSDPKNTTKKSMYTDFIPCKKLIFSADNPSLHFTFNLWCDNIDKNLQVLEELEVNFNSCNIDLRKVHSLKKVTLNSTKIYELQLSAPNLRELSLKNLDTIKSSSWNNEDIRFDNLQIPDKCKITLNKDLKWNFELCSSDPLTISLKGIRKEQISLKEMISNFHPKSLQKNSDGSYSIRFDDLKNMLTATKFKIHEDYYKEAKQKIITQRKITDSMICSAKPIKETKEK